jgi:hypothetical protein
MMNGSVATDLLSISTAKSVISNNNEISELNRKHQVNNQVSGIDEGILSVKSKIYISFNARINANSFTIECVPQTSVERSISCIVRIKLQNLEKTATVKS